MRRLVLALLLAASVHAAEVLDNAAVIRLVAAGLSADVVVLKIERSGGAFDTSTDGLIALKNAHVPDGVIRAMLLKENVVPVPAGGRRSSGDEVCANVSLYAAGNDGWGWQPASVCVGVNSLSVDEQQVAFADIGVHCTLKALFGSEPEWWFSDAKETFKFRGKSEDLDRLAAALTRARSDIQRGGCGDRAIAKLLRRP
jgi:hypothetical protein